MSVKTRNQIEIAAIASLGFVVVAVAVFSALGAH